MKRVGFGKTGMLCSVVNLEGMNLSQQAEVYTLSDIVIGTYAAASEFIPFMADVSPLYSPACTANIMAVHDTTIRTDNFQYAHIPSAQCQL